MRALKAVVAILMFAHMIVATGFAAFASVGLCCSMTMSWIALYAWASAQSYDGQTHNELIEQPHRVRMWVWLLRVPLHALEGIGVFKFLESKQYTSHGMSWLIALTMFLFPIGIEAVFWRTLGGKPGRLPRVSS